jgi:hypothetical protein
MIELRFVKRKIVVPVEGDLEGVIGRSIEVKILQSRSMIESEINKRIMAWSEWTDVPLVEPEDE